MLVAERRLTVGASNDDVELITILTVVDGCSSGHAGAPKGTLEVGDAGWVVTTGGRLDARISLDVYVEGRAEVRGITELPTVNSVIRLERGEPKVSVCVDGCL